MRVLLTGAAGFIGNALAKRLEDDGHGVTVLIRDGVSDARVDAVYGDLRDLPTVERAMVLSEADAVFHLAAQAIVPYAKRDPWNTFEDNVRGTYNLLEAFRRHARVDATCVVASSDKAYGSLNGSISYLEGDHLDGRGPYDCSKSCTDLIAQSYALEYGLRIATIRAGNVYGPGDTHSTRLVPSIVEDIVAGRSPQILSDGRPVRDYLYIDDAVEAYLAVQTYLRDLTRERLQGREELWFHPAFNFAGGEAVSVMELVQMAIDAAQRSGFPRCPEPTVIGTRTREISSQALDTRLVRLALGWRPRVPLHEGLMRTVRWVRDGSPTSSTK